MSKAGFDREPYGEYQHFKGSIWISKQHVETEVQGTNVAVSSDKYDNGTFSVLGYVIRKGDRWTFNNQSSATLDDIVWSVLKSKGLYDDYCYEILNE